MPETGNNCLVCVDSLSGSSFHPAKTAPCHISIQLCLDGFSFCIKDAQTQQRLVYKSYRFPLPELRSNHPFSEPAFMGTLSERYAEVLSSDPWLKTSVQQCKVLVDFPVSTVVPPLYFQEKLLESYFQPCTPEFLSPLVMKSESCEEDAGFLVFAVPASILQCVEKAFSCPVTWTHTISRLIAKALKYNDPALHLEVLISEQHCSIVATHEKQLLQSNTFHTLDLSDAAYYSLATLKACHGDLFQTSIFCSSLSGKYTADALVDLLSPHVDHTYASSIDLDSEDICFPIRNRQIFLFKL